MPYNYNDPRQYQFRPTKGQHVASGIGALIASALAATQGQNTGDAIARGAAGAVSGYGGGIGGAMQEYEDMFKRTLQRDQFGQQVREYEESEKPYRESEIKQNEAMANFYNQPKQQKPSVDQEEILNTQLSKLMAQKANYTSNINFNQNSPTIKQYTEQLDKRINDIQSKLKSLNPSKYDAQNQQDATALEEMLKLLNQQ